MPATKCPQLCTVQIAGTASDTKLKKQRSRPVIPVAQEPKAGGSQLHGLAWVIEKFKGSLGNVLFVALILFLEIDLGKNCFNEFVPIKVMKVKR